MKVMSASMKCVLFDLYGTLVDIRLNEDVPALWEGLAVAISDRGGTVGEPADVRRRYRLILAEEGKRRREGFVMKATFARLLEEYGARNEVASIGRVFRRLSLERLSIRPYVAPLFDALRKTSCTIGIVSNTEAVLTRFDLERYPLLLSADAVILSSDVGVKKPDPRIFHTALEILRSEPADTIVVGNSLSEDIAGARRAGLRAIYLDDDATGVAPLTNDSSVLRAAPTYGELTRALEAFGWSSAVRSRDSR